MAHGDSGSQHQTGLRAHPRVRDHTLLRCTIFSGRESGVGQKETKNHVRCHGSFRRKRPWYPPRHEHTTTIASRTADDPRQRARQRRAVARRVLLAVPPPGDLERRSVARSHGSAIVRPTHGLHPVRHHRCRRPAELAGAAGEAERCWHCAMAMSAERHRALEILAGSSLGCTEAMSAPGERRHPSAGEVGGL
jgi:hypothetical protein